MSRARICALGASLLLLPLTACSAALPGASPVRDDAACLRHDPDTVLARAVLDEINLLRTDPAAYAGFVAALRPAFTGRRMVIDGTGYRTKEGVAAVDEALAFLAGAPRCAALGWSPLLALAAAHHCADQARSGATGHIGSDGSRPSDRLRRLGTAMAQTGESIAYGFAGPPTARTIVLQLLVDDGVPTRSHRAHLFAPGFRLAGVAVSAHPRLGRVCVIEYAADFTARGTPTE